MAGSRAVAAPSQAGNPCPPAAQGHGLVLIGNSERRLGVHQQMTDGKSDPLVWAC